MTWDTVALRGRAHQGDKEAREILFHENTGLIYSVAKRFLGNSRGSSSEGNADDSHAVLSVSGGSGDVESGG